MPRDNVKISNLEIPKSLANDLKGLPDLLVENMKRDGLPIETGFINLNGMSKDMAIAMIFFRWVVRTNEVVDNLNIVLHDLLQLGDDALPFRGESHKRFYLLLRLYFYEFYRIKEIFNDALRELEKEEMLPKKSAASLADTFFQEFQDALKLRNRLVHREAYWKGKGHFDIAMVSGANELGYGILDIKKEEVVSLHAILKKECGFHFDALWIEGERISRILQDVIESFVEMLKRP